MRDAQIVKHIYGICKNVSEAGNNISNAKKRVSYSRQGIIAWTLAQKSAHNPLRAITRGSGCGSGSGSGSYSASDRGSGTGSDNGSDRVTDRDDDK